MNEKSLSTRDRGAILPLVMALMVIGALVTLPMLTYATTTLRANTVLSKKNVAGEAGKSGFRVAMADPVGLYNTCTSGSPVALPNPNLLIPTTSTCTMLGTANIYEASELPYGLTMTHAAATLPSGAGVTGSAYPGAAVPSDPTSWWDDAKPGQVFNKVWVPNLPTYGLDIRSKNAREMPAQYVLNGYPTCHVYFPGTYKEPVVIDKPVYFVSGVYYFEHPVTVKAGADAVVGGGEVPGCTDDQLAIFHAIDGPATHNASGYGATFVFGDRGRLIVDDSAGSLKLRFNQRYVADVETGALPSAKVNIMTVNGAFGPDVGKPGDLSDDGIDFELPGQIAVKLSEVGLADQPVAPTPAPTHKYKPSLLTPAPQAPDKPLNVNIPAVYVKSGAVTVFWDAADPNGSVVLDYTVTASSTNITRTCTTTTMLSCTVVGLTDDEAYTFSVIARNAIGTSPASDVVTATPTGAAGAIVAPDVPTGIIVTASLADPGASRFVDAFEVSWTNPTNDGGAPILAYTAGVTDGVTSYTCPPTLASTCVIPGVPMPVDPMTPFDVFVTASNAVDTATIVDVPFRLDPLGEAYIAPAPTPVTVPPNSPDPVVDIVSTGAQPSIVSIPGYIAVPQGVVRVWADNPAALTATLSGGMIAAWSDLKRPTQFVIGLDNPITQRTIRIDSVTTGTTTIRSQGIVQVNQNGAWQVNSWSVQIAA